MKSKLILRTRRPEPESEAGVRSLAILMNIDLTAYIYIYIYVIVQYDLRLKCKLWGSTVLQLLHVIDRWMETLDNGGSVDIIYCDFMRAFDTVPHRDS